MFQYITAASSLTNSSINSFVPYSGDSTDGENFVESTKKNFFFVRENGLFVLRKGSEQRAEVFYDFYQDSLSSYKNTFSVIMILGIVFLILAQCVLIPIVFNVHKCNNKVLSLFGIIPETEIRALATRCDGFMSNFLEER